MTSLDPTRPAPITGIRTVSIPVDDQDAALRFYVGTLGFTLLRDNPTPGGGRWIELAPGAPGVVGHPRARHPRRDPRCHRHPVHHRERRERARRPPGGRGSTTDDILRWPGVPAMFAFRDPDGNAFSITETAGP